MPITQGSILVGKMNCFPIPQTRTDAAATLNLQYSANYKYKSKLNLILTRLFRLDCVMGNNMTSYLLRYPFTSLGFPEQTFSKFPLQPYPIPPNQIIPLSLHLPLTTTLPHPP